MSMRRAAARLPRARSAAHLARRVSGASIVVGSVAASSEEGPCAACHSSLTGRHLDGRARQLRVLRARVQRGAAPPNTDSGRFLRRRGIPTMGERLSLDPLEGVGKPLGDRRGQEGVHASPSRARRRRARPLAMPARCARFFRSSGVSFELLVWPPLAPSSRIMSRRRRGSWNARSSRTL